MLSYVKARLYTKSNGSFAGNGIIVKEMGGNQTRFSLLFKAGTYRTLHIRPDSTSRVQEIAGVRFEAESENVCRTHIVNGMEIDSFETILIGERLRGDSPFANYTVVLGDDITNLASDVFAVNLDNVFINETRQETAATGILIKQAYTTGITYSGFYGYHQHNQQNHFNTPIRNDKPYRIGFELEVYARSLEAYNKIINARTNWFQCERDGSLGEYNYPIELKTIPLRPCDATSVDFLSEPMAKLKELAFSRKYTPSGGTRPVDITSTGLHVHISKEILGATSSEQEKNLDKLCWFYQYFIEENPEAHAKNVTICGRERGYSVSENGFKTELGNFAALSSGILSEVAKCDAAFRMVAGGIKTSCRNQRGDINLKHWDDYGTIEFRKGRGAIGSTRIAALCTWWEQMCLYCKETNPRDLSFDDFFRRVMQYPAVAHYFQQDEEC